MHVWLVKSLVLFLSLSLFSACSPKTEKEIVTVTEVKTVEVPVAIPGSADIVKVPQVLFTDKSVGIQSVPKSIQQAPDQIKQLGRAVAKVFSATGASGTGFFISKDGLFLTNEHVVPISACVKRRCPGYKIVTGFHKDGITKSYSDFEVLAQDKGQYDFALIKVNLKSNEQVDFLEVSLSEVSFDQNSDGSTHSVIGHPGGASLHYAQAKPMGLEDVSIRFQGVVIPGNSGGPLVDLANGKVIGLVKNMRTMPVKDNNGSAYFENLNQGTALWEIDKHLKEKTGHSILDVDATTDMKTLNLSSGDRTSPDADDFGSILRRPTGDIRVSHATENFVKLMGSNFEERALSLMFEKNTKFSGSVNLRTLISLLKFGIAAGRPLAWTSADRVALEQELTLSSDLQQKTFAQILLHYFDSEKRQELQNACLNHLPEIPQLAIMVPYNCASTTFKNQTSIYPIYADWLVKSSGYKTMDELSSVIALFMMASPFATPQTNDVKAIEQINQFVEENGSDLETLMRNDSYAMGLIKGQLGVGAFKETFQQ